MKTLKNILGFIKFKYYSRYAEKVKNTYFIRDSRLYMQEGSTPLNYFEHQLILNEKTSTLWVRSYKLNGEEFDDYTIDFNNAYLDHFKKLDNILKSMN